MKVTAGLFPDPAANAATDSGRPSEMTSGQTADVAKRLYGEAPALARTLARWRPYICPFGTLVALVPQDARVFDIGCGSGLFLGLLGATGRVAGGLGVDVSFSAIEVARTMAKQLPAGHDVEFRQHAAEAPWPHELYDVVSFIDVMHHIPPPVQRDVFARAAGCIAPGGMMIYKDIAPVPRWRALANTLHDLLLSQQRPRYTAAAKIEEWGRENGLALVSRRRIDMLWYAHDLAVFRRP
ncbi:MAG TPA: class I SAM-dependent methyltransferase [Stellaceae bacterium]|jgi:2-polyprenyl-3-methyl-5-hydroxy-6-metoxy-1,4-benzoquinol methylase|nr:class I SAM-dependent methyltransferase [Stellaceae bacterium]